MTWKLAFSLGVTLCFGMAQAQELEIAQFTGDTKLACEALLCLTAAQHPAECSPSLSRYFSFSGKNALRDRMNFLHLCPTASASPEMRALTNALLNGSGQCDIATLNNTQILISGANGTQQVISNQFSSACSAFYANSIIAASYGDADKPVYVGTPEHGGYWVAQKDYPAALADYNRQLDARQNTGSNN